MAQSKTPQPGPGKPSSKSQTKGPEVLAKQPISSPAPAAGSEASPSNDEMDSKVLHDLTQMVKAMSEGDFYRELSLKVTGELSRLAHFIDKTRKSLQHLDPSTVTATIKMPEAAASLSSITKATEEATHKILGLTEKIMTDRQTVAGILARVREKQADPVALAEDIQELARINEQNQADLIEILTNLSFQDLTGQKIKKTIQIVEDIERRILALIVAFGINVEKTTEQTLEMKAEIMSKLEGQNTIGELRQDLVDEILAQLNG